MAVRLEGLVIPLVGIGFIALAFVDENRAEWHGPSWSELRERASTVRIGITREEVRDLMGGPPRPSLVASGESWYARRLFRDRAPRIRIEYDLGRVVRVELLPSGQIPFDSSDWRRSTYRRRRLMIDDLRGRDLGGMTRQRMIALLGTPGRFLQAGEVGWFLGRSERSSSGYEWLVVEFDGNDRMIDIGVETG